MRFQNAPRVERRLFIGNMEKRVDSRSEVLREPNPTQRWAIKE